ncbi:uncharacterized protein LOC128548952 [Mercenaria mercenaria]|uniref:uncharacterized protein LOC128548952 n=1 Tax=Mercenaria mercenaria TaxID=6596 RepID=UPI00234F54AD|nr:uncharacterized protein LOC128548952 [Mercenaria mercenaria]XP_053380702.1 uncharacterized protein LOC128548952 [Mercenaria mercenaria]
MATSNITSTSNHSILTCMVYNGGTKVVKALAEKRIDELLLTGQNPGDGKVDAFLKQNQQKILGYRAGRSNEWLYFPADYSPTDFAKWDLNATIFILLEICDLGKQIRMYLEQLRKLRNKLVHLSSTDISESKFDHLKTKVSVILEKCLCEIGDDRLAMDIEEMNKRIEDGSILQNASTKHHTTHEETRNVLEKSENFDESTEKKLETTIELLQKIEPTLTSENETMEVPDIGIKITVKNCSRDKAVVISNHMRDIFNDVIYEKYDDFKELSNEYRHNMKEAVYETCMIFLSNGRRVYKAEVECVVLHIRCISLVALLILFRDYINGILDENLQALQSAVRRCEGFEDTSLEMTVYKDEFWNILSRIAVDLEKCVSIKEKQHQNPQSNGKTRTVSALSVPETFPTQRKDGMEQYMKQHTSSQESEQHEHIPPSENDEPTEAKLLEPSKSCGTDHTVPELPSEISTKEKQHMLVLSDGKDGCVSDELSVSASMHITEKEDLDSQDKQDDPKEQVQLEHDTSRANDAAKNEMLHEPLKSTEAADTDVKMKELRRPIAGCIDFGTSYAGWAWSFSDKPTKIYTSVRVLEGITNMECYKEPTAALFDGNGNFSAFGFDAEEKYEELLAKKCNQDWYFFPNFTKEISRNANVSIATKSKDVAGKEMTAVKVIADVIRYMKDTIITDVRKHEDEHNEQDVHWVLTVPGIFLDDETLFMKQAASQGGLSKIRIVSEPEAAKTYCETFVRIDKDNFADVHHFPIGLTYLLADLGGEATKISVHQITEDEFRSKMHFSTCEESGGNTVNLAFRSFLESLFGEEVINKFRLSAGRDHLDFFREFEIRKRKVNADLAPSITFKCPASLGECLLEKRNLTLQSCIAEKGLSNEIDAKTDKMRIGSKLLKEFFDEPVAKIVKALKDAIRHDEYEIRRLILVGGFSESLYVKQRIYTELETDFPTIEIEQPEEASLHVMKGAIILMNKHL